METHFPFSESTDLTTQATQLQADLKAVVRDIEELLKSAAGQLNEKSVSQLKSILERAKVLGQELEGRAAVGLRQADRVIRSHPYQSLGVAFAVGALIGVLVNRR